MLRDMDGLDAVCAQLGGVEGQCVQRLAEVAGQGQRLKRELLVRLDKNEDGHQATPMSRIISTTAGAASGPVAEHLGLLALAGRHDEAQPLEPRGRPLGRSAAPPASSAPAASPAPMGSAAG